MLDGASDKLNHNLLLFSFGYSQSRYLQILLLMNISRRVLHAKDRRGQERNGRWKLILETILYNYTNS